MGTWVSTSARMRPLILLPVTIFTYVLSQGTTSGNDECCPIKNVGGKKYVLNGTMDTSKYSCSTNCVYNMMGDKKGGKYCFKPGTQESKCMDRPPMTTGDGGGMGGMSTTGGGMVGMSSTGGGMGGISTTGGGMGGMSTTGGGMGGMSTSGGGMGGSTNGGGMGGSTTGSGGSVPSNADYCAQSSGHTMCKYAGPSNDCAAKTEVRELSDSAKQAILDKHNELRRRVAKGEETGGINAPQPGATNMKKMFWNTELEAIAQRWSDQCTFGHDSERNKLDGTSVGQNAYWGASTQQVSEADVQAGVNKATQAWYDEVTNPGFDSTHINPYQFNSGTGHYTQVVWADSEELGCGLVYYKGDQYYETLVVCNYAKAGNFLGSAMYETGTACSNCPSGYTCDDGLCAKA